MTLGESGLGKTLEYQINDLDLSNSVGSTTNHLTLCIVFICEKKIIIQLTLHSLGTTKVS